MNYVDKDDCIDMSDDICLDCGFDYDECTCDDIDKLINELNNKS